MKTLKNFGILYHELLVYSVIYLLWLILRLILCTMSCYIWSSPVPGFYFVMTTVVTTDLLYQKLILWMFFWTMSCYIWWSHVPGVYLVMTVVTTDLLYQELLYKMISCTRSFFALTVTTDLLYQELSLLWLLLQLISCTRSCYIFDDLLYKELFCYDCCYDLSPVPRVALLWLSLRLISRTRSFDCCYNWSPVPGVAIFDDLLYKELFCYDCCYDWSPVPGVSYFVMTVVTTDLLYQEFTILDDLLYQK